MLPVCRTSNCLSRRQRAALFSLILYLSCFFPSSPAESFTLTAPVTLLYDLTWSGIKAGEATIKINSSKDEVTITSIAQSAPWVSLFYTVHDVVESTFLNTQTNTLSFSGRPLRYTLNLREGRNRKHKEVIFDNQNQKALYIDHLESERKEVEIPSFIFDPLSGFFYIRTLPLEVGKSVYVTVFDSKRVWNVEVQVLRKEKITVPAGEFNTIVIKPLLQSEGIFYRKGEVYIWLTDDVRKVPVMLKSQIKIGSVNAQLTGGRY